MPLDDNTQQAIEALRTIMEQQNTVPATPTAPPDPAVRELRNINWGVVPWNGPNPIKAKIRLKNKKKRTIEPRFVNGARVFNVNRYLIENLNSGSRFVDQNVLPRLQKGLPVHLRFRGNVLTVKKDRFFMFMKDIIDYVGAKNGVTMECSRMPSLLAILNTLFDKKFKV